MAATQDARGRRHRSTVVGDCGREQAKEAAIGRLAKPERRQTRYGSGSKTLATPQPLDHTNNQTQQRRPSPEKEEKKHGVVSGSFTTNHMIRLGIQANISKFPHYPKEHRGLDPPTRRPADVREEGTAATTSGESRQLRKAIPWLQLIHLKSQLGVIRRRK